MDLDRIQTAPVIPAVWKTWLVDVAWKCLTVIGSLTHARHRLEPQTRDSLKTLTIEREGATMGADGLP